MVELMHAAIHGYLGILDRWGLLGVVALMALEGSVLPAIPTELVVPPAAYLAAAGRGNAAWAAVLVIGAGTLGAYLGASALYWVARAAGRRLVLRFGRYVFLSEAKLAQAEQWMARYGSAGIFVARFLPAVRHASAVVAGVAGMRFLPFSLMTLCGSAIWCTVLTLFGLLMAPEIDVLVRAQGTVLPAGYQRALATLSLAGLAFAGLTATISYLLLRRGRRESR